MIKINADQIKVQEQEFTAWICPSKSCHAENLELYGNKECHSCGTSKLDQKVGKRNVKRKTMSVENVLIENPGGKESSTGNTVQFLYATSGKTIEVEGVTDQAQVKLEFSAPNKGKGAEKKKIKL